MTTPRVTVPVDELAQEIRRVDGNHDLGAGALAEALVPFLSSRLSAAPAPEGGAVNHEALAKVGYEASCNKKWEWASRGCKIGWIDAVKAILAALATREEA